MDRLEKIIRPVFNLELDYKILPGLVTIGKYDGTHPCVTAGTVTDKVLIHSPHKRSPLTAGRILSLESNKEISLLNINQKVGCLTVGMIVPDDEKDILIVGTNSHILAYHVHDNKDVFYRECPDGVQSIAVGNFKDSKSPVVMVGGNSTIHGFDHLGNEIFWTPVGDIVTSVLFMDYDKDGTNELVVSSGNFNITVFKGDQRIAEHVETEVVTHLIALPENRFAYSVTNGTVGVYEQESRLWRVKSKHVATSVHYYDLLGQLNPQLITGWSNGKIDCRSVKTGEVLFKDHMGAGIAGIVEGDYRSVGKNDLICVSTSGEVRGFTTTKTLIGEENRCENDIVMELLNQKQSLLMELKQYEYNMRYNENAMNETETYENSGVIPANTRLQIAINTNSDTRNPHVEVFVATNNSTKIRAVTIFAEGIFKSESHVVHPSSSELSSEMLVPLFLPKDNPVDIHVKAMVGYPKSIQYHVFEITRQLPRFSMYALKTNKGVSKPESFVQFKINERLQRICMWINQNFLLPEDVEFNSGPNLIVNLLCLRDGTDLVMQFEISGKVTFYTSNIVLGSDLVQSLCSYLNIDHLESQANFPLQESRLKALLERLTSIQEARSKLTTDVADRLSQIKFLVIKAEDSRILDEMKSMAEHYTELHAVNQELINGHNVRLQNYNEGVETMKEINAIIQHGSRLRVGPNSANAITQCRNCIRNNNVEGLMKIMRTGVL
nr:unnamed protein product [Callosobruchus chinensis]